jgi:hypothetical protein
MANIHTFGLQECLSWHTFLHKLIEVQLKTETLERTKIYIKLTNRYEKSVLQSYCFIRKDGAKILLSKYLLNVGKISLRMAV